MSACIRAQGTKTTYYFQQSATTDWKRASGWIEKSTLGKIYKCHTKSKDLILQPTRSTTGNGDRSSVGSALLGTDLTEWGKGDRLFESTAKRSIRD